MVEMLSVSEHLRAARRDFQQSLDKLSEPQLLAFNKAQLEEEKRRLQRLIARIDRMLRAGNFAQEN